jgi:hypothetical protein
MNTLLTTPNGKMEYKISGFFDPYKVADEVESLREDFGHDGYKIRARGTWRDEDGETFQIHFPVRVKEVSRTTFLIEYNGGEVFAEPERTHHSSGPRLVISPAQEEGEETAIRVR